MNQVIKAAATDSGAYYLDIEDTLEGKNLCSGAPDSQMVVNGVTLGNDKYTWINTSLYVAGHVYANVTLGLGNESFHPNQNAQPLIRDRILELTNNNPATFLTCPSQPDHAVCGAKTNGKIPLPDNSYFGTELFNYINSWNGSSTIPVTPPPKMGQIVASDSSVQSLAIHLENLQPNSPVKLEGHSTPVDLGTFSADANGVLDTTINIGGKLPAGPHELHAYTKNIAGVSEEFYQHILITDPEGDINGNNIADTQEKCGFVPDSGVDYDQDGIDDACDGLISDPPPPPQPDPIVIPEPEPTPIEVIQPTEDPNKIPLGESVAGVSDEISPAQMFLQAQTEATITTQTLALASIQAPSPEANEPLVLGINNPQTSSNISNSFNNNAPTKDKVQKISTPDTKQNYYMLVLIPPIGILLLIAIKLIRVRLYAKEKK